MNGHPMPSQRCGTCTLRDTASTAASRARTCARCARIAGAGGVVEVVCLDTNYLILGLVAESAEARELVDWSVSGVPLITPMPAWFEFLCGPATPEQVAAMRAFVTEVVAFAAPQAEEAARLFDAAGRRRSRRVDAMIAGTAVAAGARLATGNRSNFEPFVAHGLELS